MTGIFTPAYSLSKRTGSDGAGITTLVPRLSEGVGLVTIYKDTRSAYLQFWRSVFERRAPRLLPAVEAEVGGVGVRQGNVVYEISDELLAALTAA